MHIMHTHCAVRHNCGLCLRMVPYHASTTVGEWCGWWRGLVRVHAGWKYIFTRTLPLRSGNLEEFPEIQQLQQVCACCHAVVGNGLIDAWKSRCALVVVPHGILHTHSGM